MGWFEVLDADRWPWLVVTLQEDEIKHASQRARSEIEGPLASAPQASIRPSARVSTDSTPVVDSKPSPFHGARQTWLEAEKQRLLGMKVAELKDLCRAEDLIVGGSKAELVDRLLTAKAPPAAEEETKVLTIKPTAEVEVAKRIVVQNSPPLKSRKEEKVEEAPAPLRAAAAAPPESAPASSASKVVGDVMTLMGLKVVELRDLCRENGLPVSGEKRVLIERLVEHRMKTAGGP
jgi:hypothetical protein